ncbi:MAG: twin-arginine translocase TatA/TatE family subunit [Terriglobales bacterium]|jgi:sec-independent protein translocase protein TatB
MNFGFSGEMIFLFLLALILFGPKKLPEIGRTIGRFMNEFRRASNEFRSQIESEINASDFGIKPPLLPPGQAPLGSLASRIFNPPPAEQIRTAEKQAAETRATESQSASVAEVQHAAVAPENASAAGPLTPTRESSPAPKVAPDA